MKVKFFTNDKAREKRLADYVCSGFRRRGDQAQVDQRDDIDLEGLDVACMVGVKSRKLFWDCVEAGVLPILFDKGYLRHRSAETRVWEYWRVAIGAHHPTDTLFDVKGDKKRRRQTIGQPVNWRGDGIHILLAGSSQKFHDFYGLPHPTEWAEKVVAEIRQHTDRPIVYRPKPSWHEATPIDGTHFSGPSQSLDVALRNAWAVVTYGSNACYEAAMNGIPTIVLGNAVARPISSTSIGDIESPRLGERGPWLDHLCQWQWTEKEFSRGQAMDALYPLIDDMVAGRRPWPARSI